MRTFYLFLGVLLIGNLAWGQADRNRLNRGAGISEEVLAQYAAKEFEGLPYRLLLPDGYDKNTNYPLILSLHGRGGVGNDNESQMRQWLETFVDPAWRAKFPCIVVAPQSEDSWMITREVPPEFTETELAKYSEDWRRRIRDRGFPSEAAAKGSLSLALNLLDQLAGLYAVDENRIYVLGHSMGGFGTWNAIWAAPDRFAAAIPSAGGLPPWKSYARFKDVPIWAFHGDADPTVPVDYTRQIFARMKEAGGNMKYSELPGVKHNASRWAFALPGTENASGYPVACSSDRCDETAGVWDWLFEQRLE